MKKVLLRVDFNVSMKNGKIADPFRILSHIPTIKYYLKKNYQVVLISHLEQNGKIPYFGLVRKFLEKKLGKGNYTLLENLRLNSGEKKNDLDFAKKLASFGDILGTTMYRIVWNKQTGFFDYWFLPPAFYKFKADVTKFFHDNIKEIINQFGDKVDLIIDAGNLPKRKPSSIIDLTKNKIILLRK